MEIHECELAIEAGSMVFFSKDWGWYATSISDGRKKIGNMKHCPWCGAKL